VLNCTEQRKRRTPLLSFVGKAIIIIVMKKQEHEITNLEESFPPVSAQAFAAARAAVLSSGQSVLQAEDGYIVEVFPDGTRKQIKKISPPISVMIGQKFTIR
jgi:hypothetical protein